MAFLKLEVNAVPVVSLPGLIPPLSSLHPHTSRPCPEAVPTPPCLSSSSLRAASSASLSLFTQAHWLSFGSWTPEHHSCHSLPGDVSEHIPEPLMATRPHSPLCTTPYSPIVLPFQTSDPPADVNFLEKTHSHPFQNLALIKLQML